MYLHHTSRWPNYLLLFNFLSLLVIGFLTQYSAAGGKIYPYLFHQAFVVLCIGLPTSFFIIKTNINFYYKWAYHIFILSVISLLAVHIAGKTAMGATRWISFMGLNFQPAEILKISLVLMLARYFNDLKKNDLEGSLFLLPPLLFIILPLFLILKQPSLGTFIIILLLTFSIYFAIGLKQKYFIILAVVLISSSPLIWKYGLYDYQKTRIMTFLSLLNNNGNSNNNGVNSSNNKIVISDTNYNIVQSKIAIGSGGLAGKGFLKGSQTQLKFLPEKHTDFALAVIAEEFGFFGVLLVILLYIGFCLQGILISLNAQDTFQKIIALGLSLLFFYHFLINVAMCSGLIPVVGMPLLTISYGGSIALASIISFSLLLKIDLENKEEAYLTNSSFR